MIQSVWMDDSKLLQESNLTAGSHEGCAISFYLLFNTATPSEWRLVNLFNGDADLASDTGRELGLPALTDQICDPSDRNESHVENFRIWVLYMVLKTRSLALKWHQKHGSTLLFDKVTNAYVFRLWKLLLQEKRIESLSIRLGGVKCKNHNNHSSHSNHAQNLI